MTSIFQSLKTFFKNRIIRFFYGRPQKGLQVRKIGEILECQLGDSVFWRTPTSNAFDLSGFSDSVEGIAELQGLCRYAKKGGILFDVGAHIGLMSIAFCRSNSQNRAFAFEPSPLLHDTFIKIRDLNDLTGRVILQTNAIGESEGTMEMMLDPIGGFVQTQQFEHTMWGKPQAIRIQIENLDSVCARLGVFPDFLKIDVEGFEYEAVKGARELFAKHRPTIFFEWHRYYLKQRHIRPLEVIEMLSGFGYKFFTYSNRRLPIMALELNPMSVIRFVARKE